MGDKMAQVDWNDDAFLDTDECYAKIKQLRTECKESDDYLRWLHRILREGGYILSTNEDGIPVLAHNPLRKLEREKAEAEQRAERAEALAQLVTPGLPELLEHLAEGIDCLAPAEDGIPTPKTDEAHALAAQIREALDE